MRILVLGGTAWLGGEVARTAIDAGHEVTCLARGSAGRAPDGVRLVVADRDHPDAYDEVAAERWDGVIDVSRQPGHVRSALAALAGATRRWVFVSTGNVYASHATVGADESAELLPPLEGDTMATMDDYGAAKVACEQAVLAAVGDRAVIARSGLIGGPGDESGRTGYWPWRFAHPSNADGAVLVPDAGSLPTSVIDVRDLARFLVDAVADTRISGAYDAVANRCTLAEHLAVAREVAGHTGALAVAPEEWLRAHEVAEWMGPRSLPLWLTDPEWRGFAGRSGARILETGWQPRPLAETLADVLAWEEARPSPGPHGTGLDDDAERELLAAL
jgi:nucleoside-diphosphate-sugar epimerase